jgi:hypothetical protein
MSKVPGDPAGIASWMARQDLPKCPHGKPPLHPQGQAAHDQQARQRLSKASTWTQGGEKYWRNGNCRRAWEHLAVAQRHAAGIACFTGGLSKERQRRLAKRYAHVNRRMTKLHWKLVGSCIRDKAEWTGNEIVWIAAGKPSLGGTLDKAAPHDMRKVIKIAKKQGWRVGRTRSRHYRFCPPTPADDCVITSGTPGKQGSIRKAIAQLRRSGLEI